VHHVVLENGETVRGTEAGKSARPAARRAREAGADEEEGEKAGWRIHGTLR